LPPEVFYAVMVNPPSNVELTASPAPSCCVAFMRGGVEVDVVLTIATSGADSGINVTSPFRACIDVVTHLRRCSP
jgi:hypothetical protein